MLSSSSFSSSSKRVQGLNIAVATSRRHAYLSFARLHAVRMLYSPHFVCYVQKTYFQGFKQAQRRDDDISIVNAGMKVIFDDQQPTTVRDIAFSFGGVAETTVLAAETAKRLIGR